MIIDFEHHYLPEELWLSKGGRKGERAVFYERGKPRGTLNPELCDVEEHLRVMDAVGIDMAVLSMAVSNDNTAIALEESIIWDNAAAKLIKRYPRRFSALAPVPPLGGAKALDEVDRAISELGMKGVVVRSQVNGLSMDAKELYPFYKKMSDLKAIIFIHPSGVQVGMDILKAPYDLDRSLGRELDLQIATARIILSGVLEDFPDLKFVIAHKGGGIAATMERINYWFSGPGGPEARGTRMTHSFDWYFSRMYFDMAGHHGGMNSVKCALTCISPDQLLFATDYPQEFADTEGPMKIKTYIEEIKAMGLDNQSKEMMLGGNAQKLLGL